MTKGECLKRVNYFADSYCFQARLIPEGDAPDGHCGFLLEHYRDAFFRDLYEAKGAKTVQAQFTIPLTGVTTYGEANVEPLTDEHIRMYVCGAAMAMIGTYRDELHMAQGNPLEFPDEEVFAAWKARKEKETVGAGSPQAGDFGGNQ